MATRQLSQQTPPTYSGCPQKTRLPRWYVSTIFFSTLNDVTPYQHAVKVIRTPLNDPQRQEHWQLAIEYGLSSRRWMIFLPRACQVSVEYVETDGGIAPAIIYPWFEDNILNFVVKNPHVNKLRVVGLIFFCFILIAYSLRLNTGVRHCKHIISTTQYQSRTRQHLPCELDAISFDRPTDMLSS
jgi:hypothetical protein